MDTTPRLLKIFVIGGGVLLLVGAALLLAFLLLRASRLEPIVEQLPRVLELPPGARIEQVALDGRRLALLGVDARGQQFVVLVDTATGERLGLVEIRADE